MDNKHIIMIYHIPVDGLTRQNAEQELYEFQLEFQNDEFQAVWVFPYTDGNPRKVIIETIDLKNTTNSKTVEKSLEDIQLKFLKLYEPKKYLRIQKLKRILKK